MSCYAKTGPETKARTSSTTVSKTPQQQKYITEAIDLYGPTLGEGPQVYQGPRVAPFSPLQKGVFDFADQGGFMTNPQQLADYYRDVFKLPAEYEFSRETLPAIKEAYSGPGYWGSGRAESEVLAKSDLANELRSRWGELNWDVLEANRQGAIQQFGLGGAQQEQEQNEIGAAMQKFAEENQLTNPENLAILMSLLGMDISSTTSGVTRQATTTPSWKTGDWSSLGAQTGLNLLAPGAGSAMQMAGSSR